MDGYLPFDGVAVEAVLQSNLSKRESVIQIKRDRYITKEDDVGFTVYDRKDQDLGTAEVLYHEPFPAFAHNDTLQKAFSLLKALRDHIRMIFAYMAVATENDSVREWSFDPTFLTDSLSGSINSEKRAAMNAIAQRWICLDGTVAEIRRMRTSENYILTVEEPVVNYGWALDRYYHRKAAYQFGTRVANEWYSFEKGHSRSSDPRDIEYIRNCIAHTYGVPHMPYDTKEEYELKYDAQQHLKAMKKILPGWWCYLTYIVEDMFHRFPELRPGYPSTEFQTSPLSEVRAGSSSSSVHQGEGQPNGAPKSPRQSESSTSLPVLQDKGRLNGSTDSPPTLEKWRIEDVHNGFIATHQRTNQRMVVECTNMDWHFVTKASNLVKAALRQVTDVEDWSIDYKMTRRDLYTDIEDLMWYECEEAKDTADAHQLPGVELPTGNDRPCLRPDIDMQVKLIQEEENIRCQMIKDAIALQFVKLEGTLKELHRRAVSLIQFCQRKARFEFGEASRDRYHFGDLQTLRETRNFVAHRYGVPPKAASDLTPVYEQMWEWNEIRIEFLQYMDGCLSHLLDNCHYYDRPPSPEHPDLKTLNVNGTWEAAVPVVFTEMEAERPEWDRDVIQEAAWAPNDQNHNAKFLLGKDFSRSTIVSRRRDPTGWGLNRERKSGSE